MTVAVLDSTSSPVVGVSVSGEWSAGDAGTVSCTTDASGRCVLGSGNLSRKVSAVTFSVATIAGNGVTYDSSANTDPDPDSDGTTITTVKP